MTLDISIPISTTTETDKVVTQIDRPTSGGTGEGAKLINLHPPAVEGGSTSTVTFARPTPRKVSQLSLSPVFMVPHDGDYTVHWIAQEAMASNDPNLQGQGFMTMDGLAPDEIDFIADGNIQEVGTIQYMRHTWHSVELKSGWQTVDLQYTPSHEGGKGMYIGIWRGGQASVWATAGGSQGFFHSNTTGSIPDSMIQVIDTDHNSEWVNSLWAPILENEDLPTFGP